MYLIAFAKQRIYIQSLTKVIVDLLSKFEDKTERNENPLLI